ncbi:MAG TPA: bifunctional UDP-sugar hydrolase/5'-nucleotidase [Thermoanaerobaculia bacterium]|nr:bifunctional UDP-sugar hydrolase/5'-nucleotidase [Thermoanaerobaculia bacterium]
MNRPRSPLFHFAFCILHSALLVLAGCATLDPPPTRFKILQVNDVYKIEGLEGGQSGGWARVRTLREQLESDGTPVLLLHGGDALYPSVASKFLEAKQMIDVMNLLDGDAEAFDPALIVTLGNHEFDNKDPNLLISRLAESKFQWVATNTLQCVEKKCEKPFANTQQTIVLDLDGTRVGIFGVLYEHDKGYAAASNVKAAARYAVQLLRRQGARVIVALTHEDMPDDEELVRDVEGIDVVIGGHDHLFMQQKVGGTWITKADADAKSVIVYDVTVPARGPIRTAPLRVVLDSTVAKDETVDARVQEWMSALAAKLGGNETLGMTENMLEGVEPAVRGRETALGNLLTDVAREQMGTDIAVMNGGSIRINDNVPPGPITRYDMEGIFYYKNGLVAFRVTGQQLLDMLRNSVSRVDAGDGRFLQVSGIRYAYSKQGGKFVVDPADVQVNGRPLDLNATYSVAASDFMYLRGMEDNYELFTDANRPPKINEEREADWRETVEAHLRKMKTVDVEVEGRIVRK